MNETTEIGRSLGKLVVQKVERQSHGPIKWSKYSTIAIVKGILHPKFDESMKAADGIQKIKISKRWGTFANEGLKYLFREETIFKYSRLQES